MKTIPLYDGAIPLSVTDFVPTLTYYEPTEKTSDAAVIIFPGGGYNSRAPHEGGNYAEFFQAHGITAFVCNYRVKPEYFPRPLLDARRAVRYVKAHTNEYGIHPKKILVMGSSAGGHLASLVSTYRGMLEGEENDPLIAVSSVPNGTILCYPVIDMIGQHTHLGSKANLLGMNLSLGANVSTCDIVSETTPPAFLWHTSDDSVVNVANSYKYALALRERNIPAEVHVFPHGHHGLGLSSEDAHVAQWSELLLNWMKVMGF